MTASDVTDPPTAAARALPSAPGPVDSALPAASRSTEVYGRALLSRLAGRGGPAAGSWQLRDGAGRAEDLDAELDRWLGPCGPADRSVLDRCPGATLDVGCGPGRLVAELAGAGVDALGIDVSEVAVRLTRRRGGDALSADVFGAVPAEGSWDGVLLLDGNVGIGADPVRLVRRCAALLAPGGHLLVELDGPGRASGPVRLRMEGRVGGEDHAGPWFRWARLSVDDVARVATAASLRVGSVWSEEDRWFADLVR